MQDIVEIKDLDYVRFMENWKQRKFSLDKPCSLVFFSQPSYIQNKENVSNDLISFFPYFCCRFMDFKTRFQGKTSLITKDGGVETAIVQKSAPINKVDASVYSSVGLLGNGMSS